MKSQEAGNSSNEWWARTSKTSQKQQLPASTHFAYFTCTKTTGYKLRSETALLSTKILRSPHTVIACCAKWSYELIQLASRSYYFLLLHVVSMGFGQWNIIWATMAFSILSSPAKTPVQPCPEGWHVWSSRQGCSCHALSKNHRIIWVRRNI